MTAARQEIVELWQRAQEALRPLEAQQSLEAVRALLPADIRNVAPESTANSEKELRS